MPTNWNKHPGLRRRILRDADAKTRDTGCKYTPANFKAELERRHGVPRETLKGKGIRDLHCLLYRLTWAERHGLPASDCPELL